MSGSIQNVKNDINQIKIDAICNLARKSCGSKKYYRNGQNYCQGFVADIYLKAGANKQRMSKGSAKEAYRAWCVSTRQDNIPRGACVYFTGTNSKYGHVGIYIGNNLVIHAWGKAGVIYDTLSSASTKAKRYLGWGWNGGVSLLPATSTNKISNNISKGINAVEKSIGDITIDTGGTPGTSDSSSISGGTKTTPIDITAYGGTTLTIADKSGTPEKIQVYHAQSKDSIKKWGLLRYFEEISTPSIGQNKAATLLELYNRKTRKLTVSDAFGDPNVRAGTLIPVKLDLGDVEANNYMLVEKVKHKFTKDTHMMDLELEGAWSD